MKTLVISALAAVISHALLLTVNPSWQKPQVKPHKNRSVTVTLATLAPKPPPVKRPLPLPQPQAAPVSPLKPLALKKPLPEPKPVPEPKPPAAAPKAMADPAPQPAPEPVQQPPAAAPVVASVPQTDHMELPFVDDQLEIEAEIVVSDPFPIFHPKPNYPRLAQRRHYQGTVILQALVDVHGRVVRVDLVQSSGYAILDRSAKDSVLKWRFEPATRDGVAIEKTVEFPVVFRIE